MGARAQCGHMGAAPDFQTPSLALRTLARSPEPCAVIGRLVQTQVLAVGLWQECEPGAGCMDSHPSSASDWLGDLLWAEYPLCQGRG